MKCVKAVIRPEKVFEVLDQLSENGFHAVTRISVLGRGKQRGLKVGDVYYDEIPKEMIEIVLEDEDCDKVVGIIEKFARTDNSGKMGSRGDGKIFISTVERAITVSTKEEKL